MSQEIIFTTLPHERAKIDGEQFLKLSVFVSIKLGTSKDTRLKEFEDILAWPQKLREAEFQFRLQNGTILDAEFLREKIDPELYQNIFHEGIRVDDFKQEDFSVKKVYSFPMQHVQQFVLQNYKQIAIESPTKKVTPELFVDENKLGAISRFKLDARTIDEIETPQRTKSRKAQKNVMFKSDDDRQIKNTIKRNQFTRFSKQMNPKSDFTELRQFHKLDKKTVRPVAFQIKKPSFEFHDILAVVNSYPQIMRKLGFVLDFLISYNSSIPNNGTIALVPKSLVFEEDNHTVSIPETAYQLTSTGFYIGDRSNTIFKQGFVKINTDEFSVVQVDTDGVALKTSNMAENKVQQIANFYQVRAELAVSRNLQIKQIQDVEPPEEEGLPYMRSAGIAITKNGMAEHLMTSVKLNVTLQQSFISAEPKTLQLQPKPIQGISVAPVKLKVKLPSTVLFTEDVIQGYRMDIAYEDDPSTWYSLHQRQDQYTWFDENNNPYPIDGITPDEGCIQLGIAEDPDDPDDVFVSETLARWEGWSLSVRKPGYAINESDDYELKEGETQKRDFVYKTKTLEAKKYEFDPDLEFKINAQSKIVPRTLPKLRFGYDYRVRIRAVDLAGNSVSINHQSESPLETVRSNIRYMRYEPLASPIVLVGNELKDGEFLERMVIRSNYDRNSNDYEREYRVEGKEFDDFSQRYLLPPKNSQLMAENHGKFEEAFNHNPVAAREIYKIITNHEGLYEQDEKNKEKIYQPSDVEIIYLPDPMAAGVSLFIADGYDNTHTQEFKPRMFGFFTNKEIKPASTNVDIPVDWYNAGVVRIRLEEGEMDTDWDSSARIFTVYMPKGHRMRIKFSTFWREKDFKELSAVWQMVKEESPGNYTELEDLARMGQHWMVSPSSEMKLVHAVQQPVEPPEINALIPERDFNTTFSEINTKFTVHGESTEKVELQAKWIDPFDDAISVTIKEKQGRNSIPDITVNYHDEVITKGTIPKPEELVAPAKEFKIQRPLKIQKRTIVQFEQDPQPGANRINKLYKKQSVEFKQVEKTKVSAKKDLVGKVRYDFQNLKFSFLKQVEFRIKPLEHHFGDTKHRWVDYKLVASSRYREYFDKILKNYPELTTTRESDWMERVNILSSARPKAPDIDYIIPTFEWRKTQTGDAIRHQRLGGGLRIFLKRPWFSSGVDEKLAVILPYKTAGLKTMMMATSSSGYTPYYTHWGMDPLLIASNPDDYSPKIQDFRMNPVVDSDLEYPDQENMRATAVSYPVHFDEERQVWFCDLAIDPKSMYFPFVKLALARYQQHSVVEEKKDACLSPVVMADMMQLVPERQTTLRFKKDDQNSKFTLIIEGTIFNERIARYGNYSFIRISFLDSRIAQPIFGVISDGSNERKLEDEGVEIKITQRDVKNNRFTISNEFRLPRDYKTAPFQIIIEEYERGPNKMEMKPGYDDRLEQSEQTDRLIYADVFKINEVDK